MFPPLKYAKSRAKLRWVALIGGWAARAACWTPRCRTRPADSRPPPRSCPPPSPPPPPPPSPSPPQAARIPPSLWATPQCSLARRQCRTLVDWGWPRGRKECWQNRSIQLTTSPVLLQWIHKHSPKCNPKQSKNLREEKLFNLDLPGKLTICRLSTNPGNKEVSVLRSLLPNMINIKYLLVKVRKCRHIWRVTTDIYHYQWDLPANSKQMWMHSIIHRKAISSKWESIMIVFALVIDLGISSYSKMKQISKKWNYIGFLSWSYTSSKQCYMTLFTGSFFYKYLLLFFFSRCQTPKSGWIWCSVQTKCRSFINFIFASTGRYPAIFILLEECVYLSSEQSTEWTHCL